MAKMVAIPSTTRGLLVRKTMHSAAPNPAPCETPRNRSDQRIAKEHLHYAAGSGKRHPQEHGGDHARHPQVEQQPLCHHIFIQDRRIHPDGMRIPADEQGKPQHQDGCQDQEHCLQGFPLTGFHVGSSKMPGWGASWHALYSNKL